MNEILIRVIQKLSQSRSHIFHQKQNKTKNPDQECKDIGKQIECNESTGRENRGKKSDCAITMGTYFLMRADLWTLSKSHPVYCVFQLETEGKKISNKDYWEIQREKKNWRRCLHNHQKQISGTTSKYNMTLFEHVFRLTLLMSVCGAEVLKLCEITMVIGRPQVTVLREILLTKTLVYFHVVALVTDLAQ